MRRTLTKIAIGCASATLLLGATTISASAYYLGYANGDPGNWDFYQEQHNGASPPPVEETMLPPPDYYYGSGRRTVHRDRPVHGHLRMETPRRSYE